MKSMGLGFAFAAISASTAVAGDVPDFPRYQLLQGELGNPASIDMTYEANALQGSIHCEFVQMRILPATTADQTASDFARLDKLTDDDREELLTGRKKSAPTFSGGR